MSKIKLVIFDLDGTLIDTDKLIWLSYKSLFDKYLPDYKVTFEEMVSFLGPALKEMFPKYFKEDVDTLIEEYKVVSLANHATLVNSYPHALETLKALKDNGLKVAVVTSKRLDVAMLGLRQFSLDRYVDEVIDCDMVSKFKPDPEGINLVLTKYQISKDEALMVGDSPSDILAGKNAFIKTAAVNYSIKGKFYQGLNPDYVIDSLKDILDICLGK